jgi:hypothetical protein
MKKYFLPLSVLLLLLVMSCAGAEKVKKSMSEDMGSPKKEALLRVRVNEFWSAFMKEDYEKVYALYDPFFRARMPKNVFLGNLGKIKYHGFETKEVKVEGNTAKTTVKITYSVPFLKMKTQEFNVPETTTELIETWLYVYDNWYKEYYSSSESAGAAKY